MLQESFFIFLDSFFFFKPYVYPIRGIIFPAKQTRMRITNLFLFKSLLLVMAIRFRKVCANNCFTRSILLFLSRSKTIMRQQKMLSYSCKFVTVGMFKFLKIREFLAYSKFSNIPRQSRKNDSYYCTF